MNHNDDMLEKDYEELNRLGQKLHIPIPNLHYEILIERKDKPPELIRSRSHTWVRNLYNHLFVIYAGLYGTTLAGSYGAGSLRCERTSGTDVTEISSTYMGHYVSHAEASNYGILVGTNDTAFSYEHYALVDSIAHGTGTGQLSYAAQTVQTPAYTSGTKTWAQNIVRKINNNSGANISINEIALVMGQSGFTVYQMHARDVLAEPIVMADGDQITVTYINSMTFPA